MSLTSLAHNPGDSIASDPQLLMRSWRIPRLSTAARVTGPILNARIPPRPQIMRTMSTNFETPNNNNNGNAVAGPSRVSVQRDEVPTLAQLGDLRPPRCQGMSELDRDAFRVSFRVLAVRMPGMKIAAFMKNKAIQPYLLDMERSSVRPIVADPSSSAHRYIRLRVAAEDELSAEARRTVEEQSEGTKTEIIELGYDAWSTSEILNAILPQVKEDQLAPSSFTQTGHIGHVNLREEFLPYKKIIAQVLLDKNDKLRTIVNKLDMINTEFRFFDMEVLAGDPDMLTTVNESDCTFTFDFSKVYWNSRLQGEHLRLISLLKPRTVVADVMAGVGPFAVPAAKRGCYVLGNDLNPESVKWMRVNQRDNKVQRALRVFEMDGREFIRQSPRMVWEEPFAPIPPTESKRVRSKKARGKAVQPDKQSLSASPNPPVDSFNALSLDTNPNQASRPMLPTGSGSKGLNGENGQSAKPTPTPTPENVAPQLVQHYIMNLPDSALTFLDAYWGLYSSLKDRPGFRERLQEVGRPMIHVYCFTRGLELETATEDICQRASAALGHVISPSIQGYNLHLVRRVAPHKDMYCLSFTLPEEVAFATTSHPNPHRPLVQGVSSSAEPSDATASD